MPHLANARLTAQMQRILERDFYTDRAVLIVESASGTYDALNNPVVTTTETAINCSYTDKPSNEIWAALADVAQTVGEIRFKEPRPTKGNKVRITHRYDGRPLPVQTLEIAGINDRGALGFVCALKAVEI